jgi:hypothetical protein
METALTLGRASVTEALRVDTPSLSRDDHELLPHSSRQSHLPALPVDVASMARMADQQKSERGHGAPVKRSWRSKHLSSSEAATQIHNPRSSTSRSRGRKPGPKKRNVELPHRRCPPVDSLLQ